MQPNFENDSKRPPYLGQIVAHIEDPELIGRVVGVGSRNEGHVRVVVWAAGERPAATHRVGMGKLVVRRVSQ